MHPPPPDAQLIDSDADPVALAIETWAGQPGPLLPILHDIQDRLGFVPPDALPLIAKALHLSRADVHGVLSFYHDFRTEPPGRRIVRICRAESCQSRGAEALVAHAEQRLSVQMNATSADGAHSLLPVYCLGNCALSPAVQIDGQLHGRVDPDRLDALLDGAE